MGKTKNWKKITKQPKSKAWIDSEYKNEKTGESILLYKQKNSIYNWVLWTGKTVGSGKGRYRYSKTKAEAYKYMMAYMRGN